MDSIDTITPEVLQKRLQVKIQELAKQPDYSWQDGRVSWSVEANGAPTVRVAVANSDMNFDLWKNLRNPAKVGLFPIGYQEIWDFFADNRKKKTDELGRSTIFQIAETFDNAMKRYKRAVVITTMLATAPESFSTYNKYIRSKRISPWEGFGKVWSEVNSLLDKGTTRLAYDLMREDRAAIVMNQANISTISEQAVPVYQQDASHGVCKGGNFSIRSVAVLTGLGQFGVSRNFFRDELQGDEIRRLAGPIRCIVLFDEEEPANRPQQEVLLLTEKWREHVSRLSDFTITDSSVNRLRFCPYIPESGESGCDRCMNFCASGALPNSSPQPDGTFSDSVARQSHRFWNGALQFDSSRCLDYRTQNAALYSEWPCGRCLSICAGEGVMRESAVRENNQPI